MYKFPLDQQPMSGLRKTQSTGIKIAAWEDNKVTNVFGFQSYTAAVVSYVLSIMWLICGIAVCGLLFHTETLDSSVAAVSGALTPAVDGNGQNAWVRGLVAGCITATVVVMITSTIDIVFTNKQNTIVLFLSYFAQLQAAGLSIAILGAYVFSAHDPDTMDFKLTMALLNMIVQTAYIAASFSVTIVLMSVQLRK